MGAAAYARGSRAISAQVDREMQASIVRADHQAHKDERTRLLRRIADLEHDLGRARRSVAVLRATLRAERAAHAEERDQADRHHRFAVRVLARRAGLEGALEQNSEEQR